MPVLWPDPAETRCLPSTQGTKGHCGLKGHQGADTGRVAQNPALWLTGENHDRLGPETADLQKKPIIQKHDFFFNSVFPKFFLLFIIFIFLSPRFLGGVGSFLSLFFS